MRKTPFNFFIIFRREFARKPVSVFKTGSCASGQRPTDETEEEANPEDANKMASNQVNKNHEFSR